MPGTIGGSSKEKIYQELALESLQLRRWYRKLENFSKFTKAKVLNSFLKLVPAKIHTMLQEMLITSPFLTLGTTSSKTLSFYNHCIVQIRSYPLELKSFTFKLVP